MSRRHPMTKQTLEIPYSIETDEQLCEAIDTVMFALKPCKTELSSKLRHLLYYWVSSNNLDTDQHSFVSLPTQESIAERNKRWVNDINALEIAGDHRKHSHYPSPTTYPYVPGCLECEEQYEQEMDALADSDMDYSATD
jgi:hypothetical protein